MVDAALMQSLALRSFCRIGVIAALLYMPAAHASPLPDAQQVISYAVVDQDLRDVLAGIGAQLGLRTEISPHVHGQVHGRLSSATARVMLDRLAALYGFDWYCVGHTLYVSSYAEAATKVLPLGSVVPGALLQTLQQLGVSDRRWPVRIAAAADVAVVSGPPQYTTLVNQTLTALAQAAKADTTEVRVFRGTAASP